MAVQKKDGRTARVKVDKDGKVTKENIPAREQPKAD